MNQLVEELVASGVVVVVAAGNSAERRSAPPASAPSAITVGGYTDENQFAVESFSLYHSSHGETADGLVKPELLAPAMFVAAPILPGTPDYERAELLSLLAGTPDYALSSMLAEYAVVAGLPADVGRMTPDAAREAIQGQIAKHKLIANHYQHVDGTSFASPITASVAALMLEANPRLTPAAVKNALISTASRLAGQPALRQGFGMINADLAVSAAAAERHDLVGPSYHAPRIERGRIIFKFHHDTAARVSVVGDFNRWDPATSPFVRSSSGLWHAEIPCLPAGDHHYKLLVDGDLWIEDPSHGYKTEDGFGGFNSILRVG
jgi:serine protease AprX